MLFSNLGSRVVVPADTEGVVLLHHKEVRVGVVDHDLAQEVVVRHVHLLSHIRRRGLVDYQVDSTSLSIWLADG